MIITESLNQFTIINYSHLTSFWSCCVLYMERYRLKQTPDSSLVPVSTFSWVKVLGSWSIRITHWTSSTYWLTLADKQAGMITITCLVCLRASTLPPSRNENGMLNSRQLCWGHAVLYLRHSLFFVKASSISKGATYHRDTILTVRDQKNTNETDFNFISTAGLKFRFSVENSKEI